MSKTMSETMLMTKRTSSKFTMASAALLALCATAALIAQVPAGTLAMRNGEQFVVIYCSSSSSNSNLCDRCRMCARPLIIIDD